MSKKTQGDEFDGYLTVYTGPMFSGKTTYMIKEVTKYADNGYNCCIINNKLDTRDVENCISSNSSSYKGLSEKIHTQSSFELLSLNVSMFDVVAIDECNFFTDLTEAVQKWLGEGKHIIVSGLDGDYMGNKFGQVSDLLNMSDEFIKLRAFCAVCMKNEQGFITPNNLKYASFTGKISKDNSIIDVGGSDKYLPLCRKHHLTLNKTNT